MERMRLGHDDGPSDRLGPKELETVPADAKRSSLILMPVTHDMQQRSSLLVTGGRKIAPSGMGSTDQSQQPEPIFAGGKHGLFQLHQESGVSPT